MNHFIDVNRLSRLEVEQLIERAFEFKKNRDYPNYSSYTVANLFYEPSTRTKVSFELAAKHLNMNVVNLSLEHSSETKGECIQDTLNTLAAMGISLFVVRHMQDNLPHSLSIGCDAGVHIINAGDGQNAHPSQAMLDLMTILEKKPNLNEQKVLIVGDLRHSRVANSLQKLFSIMNLGELVLVSPEIWQPETIYYGRTTTDLHKELDDADVVVCLRVQRERISTDECFDLTDYRKQFSITKEQAAYLKPDAMIMHPGPMNRGIEIDSAIADGSHSSIRQQVQNGVYMRMAVFDALARDDSPLRNGSTV